MPVSPLSQADLIELWRRINPPSYTEPIESEQNGQGFDVPSAQADIFAFADQNVNITLQSHFLKPSAIQTAAPAAGPSKAITTVEISRVTSTVGALTLSQGTRLIATQTGTLGQAIQLIDFELVADLVMPEGNRGPIAAGVRAVVDGYVGNVPAETITGFRELGRASVEPCDVLSTTTIERKSPPAGTVTDQFTSAMLGRFVVLVGLPSGVFQPVKIIDVDVDNQIITVDTDLPAGDVGATGVIVQVAELADIGLRVNQPNAAVGGVNAMLDAIGRDRRSGRVAGETDTQYRERLCELADTISPAAIERIAASILTPCGINFALKETREINELKGFTWDSDPYDFGQIPPVPRLPTAAIFGEGNVWNSQSTATTFFILCVGGGNLGEFGAPYDANPPGISPPNAWSQFFWDGAPLGYNSCLGQVYEAIEGARAAGINWRLLFDPGLT